MATKSVPGLLIIFALAFAMLIAVAQGSPLVQKGHIMQHCMNIIKKAPPYGMPSERCIHVLVESNIAAVCGVINAEDEEKISVERLVEIASKFGQPLEPGVRCGTQYIVPHPPPPAPRRSTSMRG
ncbi:hypothetical protein ACP70R_034959 [Stipagrostis hirtigluma subsp. patula]